MKVKLLAVTEPTADLIEFADERENLFTEDERLFIVEFAGRNCYQSFNKGRATKEYLENIIKQKHFSVLEHVNLTLEITDVPLYIMTEFIRHRHLSYSIKSLRYTEPRKDRVKNVAENEEQSRVIDEIYFDCIEAYHHVITLDKRDVPIKIKMELARTVLPLNVPTSMVVTGNIRSWREFLEKRDSPGADLQFQTLSKLIKTELVNSIESLGELCFGNM